MVYWITFNFIKVFTVFVVYTLDLLLQATAEQIRLAQMIYDKNDADFEDKVNQVRKPKIFADSTKCTMHLLGCVIWALT